MKNRLPFTSEIAMPDGKTKVMKEIVKTLGKYFLPIQPLPNQSYQIIEFNGCEIPVWEVGIEEDFGTITGGYECKPENEPGPGEYISRSLIEAIRKSLSIRERANGFYVSDEHRIGEVIYADSERKVKIGLEKIMCTIDVALVRYTPILPLAIEMP